MKKFKTNNNWLTQRLGGTFRQYNRPTTWIIAGLFGLMAVLIGGFWLTQLPPKAVQAAVEFSMATGEYGGSGAARSITGLGFQPDLVIIKADTAQHPVWRSSAMTGDSTAYFNNAATNLGGAITSLDSNGFTLSTSATINTSNVRYTWTAFGGTGDSFSVGSYVGNSADNRSITGVGFQPDLVWVKRNGTTAGVWRSSAMVGDISLPFGATAAGTNQIQAMEVDGFQVGNDIAVNTTGTYYYVAFKNTVNKFTVGIYTGNDVDNRSIAGLGFQPSSVWTKSTSGTVTGVMRNNQQQGDESTIFNNTANAVNNIQALEGDGFQIGSDLRVNANGGSYYYVAWGGAPISVPAGVFQMNTGSYVGTGVAGLTVIGVGFQPELVIVKSDVTQHPIWKSSSMGANSSSYFNNALSNFTTGITSLDSDGFTLGSNATVSAANTRFTWTAFSGIGTNFKVGVYTGNGEDDRSIAGVGFQPDMVWIKGQAAVAGIWRSSAMVGDISQVFGLGAESANQIQALQADGFQIGSDAGVNTAAVTYFYVAFKNTANQFNVGTYTGNGVDDRSITGVGFKPDLVFNKLATSITGTNGVFRSNQQLGNETSQFAASVNAADQIQVLQADGFQVGTHNNVNAGGVIYYYAAWAGVPAYVPSGTFQMNSGNYVGTGVTGRAITGVGFQPDLVIIKADTAQYPVWRSSAMAGTMTSYLDNPAVNIAIGILSLDSDGFTLSTSATVNGSLTRYTWTAFAGVGTNFKVGAYTGVGVESGQTRSITGVGFQPDMVWIKGNVATAGVWTSSAMPANRTQYFGATAETTGHIVALESDGFRVDGEATVNAPATLYTYVAFKNTVGTFNAGTYTGNGADDRSITGVGFQPSLVLNKPTLAVGGVMRSNQQMGDETNQVANLANAVDQIQALEVGGFQVGTNPSVNLPGATYYYTAWASVPTPALPSNTPFQMSTGTYVGSGGARSIVGAGFRPDLVIIKADTAQHPVWKSSVDGGEVNWSAYFNNAAVHVTGAITSLDADGFTLSTNATVNELGTRYTWTAFYGIGTSFKVGAYTGTGGDDRNITGVGFQPNMVWIKGNTASVGVWRSSAMTGDVTQFFGSTAEQTDKIQALQTDGFQVGAGNQVNATGITYFYVAFKNTTNQFNVGTYTGNGVDNRSITGVGFQPDLVFDKAVDTTFGVLRNNQLVGDDTNAFSTFANSGNQIQALEAGGFQVGTNPAVNTNAVVYYYAAWAGADEPPTPPVGVFAMNSGSYVGSGTAGLAITGVGFRPDLVMIKADTNAGAAVWRSSTMTGDSTSYFGDALANISSGITSLDSDGFTLGAHVTVNTANVRYTWTAFYGSGSTNFKVGSYIGNGGDNVSRTGVGFQPDMVWVKGDTTQVGVWRSSAMIGDISHGFGGFSGGVNHIQSLEADGFQVGTDAKVNTVGITYFYVAFKNTANQFNVGTYTGNGIDNRSITGVGFEPDLVFNKIGSSVVGVFRDSQLFGDETGYFGSQANGVNLIQTFEVDGFQIGTDTSVNFTGSTYYYAAWTGVPTPSAPTGVFQMNTGSYVGSDVNSRVITGVGFRPDLVIIKADTAQHPVWKSSTITSTSATYFGNANAGLTTGIISLDGAGFTLGTSATVNESRTRYTWTAFAGIGTNFKVGAYTGTGGDDRSITGVGFQPDMVWIKGNAATVGVWRSSTMVGDVTQSFGATAEAANKIQALAADGFQIGTDATVNTAATTYFYVAFKNTINQFNVGTYTGNGVDDRSIIGIGFNPDLVFDKAVDASSGVFRNDQLFGDETNQFLGATNAVNQIQAFEADGFQVGTHASANTNTVVYYYAAWTGAPAPAAPTGVFQMNTGSYIGTGVDGLAITGVGFRPDLVIIKADNSNYAVWKSSAMDPGTGTNNFGTATLSSGDYIKSLDSDGFTVASSSIVNAVGVRYTWTAFAGIGTNFKVGAYTGTGGDNRSITGVGFQPDMVFIKGDALVASVWRSSAMVGDVSQVFYSAAEVTDRIQALEVDGFQVGTNAAVNTISTTYFYVAFKNTINQFNVGTYAGNGVDNRSIVGVGFNPDLAWVKSSAARSGVMRNNQLVGDDTNFFENFSNGINHIQALEADGFQVGTSTSVNFSGDTYYYATWGGVPEPAPGPITHFVVDAPVTATTGVLFQVTVTAKDIDERTTTDVGAVAVGVTVTTGTVLPLTVAIAEFADDGIWTGNVTISDIIEQPAVTLTFAIVSVASGEDVVAVTGLPTAPQNVSAARVSDTNFLVSWQDTSVVETAWHIERASDIGIGFGAWEEVGSVGANVIQWNDNPTNNPSNPPVADARYQYRVRASNASGYGDYGTDAVIHYTTPATPGAVTGTRVSDSAFSVFWQILAAVVNSHRVQRDSNDDAFLTDLGVYTTTPQQDTTGLVVNSKYRWRVRAEATGSLLSDWSYSNYEYTTPASPTGVSAAVNTLATNIIVSWTDNSAYEDGFRVWVAVDAGGYTEITPGTNTVGANITSYVYTTALPNHLYKFKVFAHVGSTPNNDELFSAEVETTISTPLYSRANVPTELADGIDGTSMILTWNANSNAVGTEYLVENITDATNSGWVTGTTYTFTNLVPGTTYSFRIKARNTDNVETIFSDSVAIYLSYPLANVPANVGATGGEKQVSLTWEANGNPEGTEYQAENITDSVSTDWITNLFTTFSNLLDNTTYSFRVKARNADNVETAYSETVTATTSAAVVVPPPGGGSGGSGGGGGLPSDSVSVINVYMDVDERQELTLWFRNLSNTVWGDTLRLGTIDPADRASIFFDSLTWLSPNRVARYFGPEVGYGGEIELTFHLQAPSQIGTYVEKFALVLEGQSWLPMSPVTLNIFVTQPEVTVPEVTVPEVVLPPAGDGAFQSYAATLVGQSPALTLRPNQTGELWVEIRNTGTLSWDTSGSAPLRLGTANLQDRLSQFYHLSWLSESRPDGVWSAGRTRAMTIRPNDVVRFTFTVQAPSNAGQYLETFQPLLEWISWLPGGEVSWELVVQGEPVLPPTTGGTPEPVARFLADIQNWFTMAGRTIWFRLAFLAGLGWGAWFWFIVGWKKRKRRPHR